MIRKSFLLIILLLCPALSNAQSNGGNSRQVYHQAAREPQGSARSIALYLRYTQLEPDDAWGHLALAESFAAARRFDEAFGALRAAERLAPSEGDVAIVRSRVNRAYRASLPAFKPNALAGRDSDGNTSMAIGAGGDVAIGKNTRFGLLGAHTTTATAASSASMNRGAATLTVRTPLLRWTSEVGAAHITHDSSYTAPVGQTHLRWSRNAAAPVVDVRLLRTPVTAAYSLVHAEAMLTEGRVSFDLPIARHLKLRARGQLGSLDDKVDPLAPQPTPNRGRQPRNTTAPYTESNRRAGYGGALVRPISPTAEVAGNVYRLTYEHAGSGNYFAPQFVDLLEISSYAEVYRFDPLTLAFDAGLGIQRAKLFDAEPGGVTPAARLWTQVSMPLAPFVELAAEIDAYKSQLSTVATSASWSSVSGGLSIRWLIR